MQVAIKANGTEKLMPALEGLSQSLSALEVFGKCPIIGIYPGYGNGPTKIQLRQDAFQAIFKSYCIEVDDHDPGCERAFAELSGYEFVTYFHRSGAASGNSSDKGGLPHPEGQQG